jgi:DNA processing protein
MWHRIGSIADVARCVDRDSAEYPSALDALDDAPKQLWIAGDATVLGGKLVAIVGTRAPTSYGLRVARSLAEAFVAAGAVVVSGLAKGIDAAAHRATLDAGGRTIAVVAGGVDVATPPTHRALQERIAADGAVLSEWALGVAAKPWHFPLRNRIIAGLAPLTIVVEAGHKSGAIITAEQAEAAGRLVAAVPGPIDAPQSMGTNQLLRDGAHIIASVDDALLLAGLARATRPETPAGLSADGAVVWAALGRQALELDGIIAATNLPTPQAATAVGELELQGLIDVDFAGVYHRVLR